MKNLKDFENEICPNEGKLMTDKEEAFSKILDEEEDVLECKFNNDGCVEIDTHQYSYITLSRSNLESLLRLIDEADDYFEIYFKNNPETEE